MLEDRQAALKPALDQIAALEAALVPYEKIKSDLSAARARFRKLTDAFVSELKNRCGFMGEDKKRALVLKLFEEDVQAGLNTAVSEKKLALTRLVGNLWDKYSVTLSDLGQKRTEVERRLGCFVKQLGYEP